MDPDQTAPIEHFSRDKQMLFAVIYTAGKGLPLGTCLSCLTVSLSLSHWNPVSGVVLDCIDS